MKETMLNLVKKAGMTTAKAAVNSASYGYIHQAKEPANAKEICKKN